MYIKLQYVINLILQTSCYQIYYFMNQYNANLIKTNTFCRYPQLIIQLDYRLLLSYFHVLWMFYISSIINKSHLWNILSKVKQQMFYDKDRWLDLSYKCFIRVKLIYVDNSRCLCRINAFCFMKATVNKWIFLFVFVWSCDKKRKHYTIM
jgi:hypothetical protein